MGDYRVRIKYTTESMRMDFRVTGEFTYETDVTGATSMEAIQVAISRLALYEPKAEIHHTYTQKLF